MCVFRKHKSELDWFWAPFSYLSLNVLWACPLWAWFRHYAHVCDWLTQRPSGFRLVAKRSRETGSWKIPSQAKSSSLSFGRINRVLRAHKPAPACPVVSRPPWAASSPRNPRESRRKKRNGRRPQPPPKLRRRATRFPLATTARRLRSSTAGTSERR